MLNAVSPQTRSAGFTLAELAIVLLVVTLLIAGALTPIASQIELQRVTATQKTLDDVKDALTGFALSRGYLPCPDLPAAAFPPVAGTVANDGLEDVNAATGICATLEGDVPWATLGVGDSDAWGNRLHYRVTSAFASRAPAATVSLSSAGGLRVCTTAACAATLATAVPAVVLSYGRNGYGALSASGVFLAAPPAANTDETANVDANTDFVSRPKTDIGATAGEFDDLVVWISASALFNRMVAAGRLP